MQINPRETFGMAFTSVWTNKFRSGLTILGIVIGITTVVTVASLLAGLRGGIVEFFEEFGPDNIFVARVSGDPSGNGARPKELKRKKMEPVYADYIKQLCPAVEDVSVALFVNPPRGKVFTAKVPGYETDRIGVVGATANSYTISPRELASGRVFNEEEERRAAKVAMLGYSTAEALFPGGGALGHQMQLDGAEYTVIGVFEKAKGGFFGENGMDYQVTVPLSTLRLRYPQAENFFMTAKARPGKREDAMEEIRNALRRVRHVPEKAEDDFALSTGDSIIESFDKVTGMILLISVALSGMGLLVGGIGVMNIMLISVTERTREIGLRKAVGARRQDIILQFLSEAVALTGVGGIVGIVFSIAVTLLVSLLVPSIKTAVPAWAVTAGLGVSVSVGVFFGVWPAVVASRLDPVEALRHE